MLFYYVFNVEEPGLECQKNIFLVYKGENDTLISTVDVINDKSNLEILRNKGIDLRFVVLPGMGVPMLVVPEGIGDDASKIVGVVHNNLNKTSDINAQKAIMQKIKAALLPQIGEAMCSVLLPAAKQLYEWKMTGKLVQALQLDSTEIDVDLRAHTVKVLEEINSGFVQAITSIAPAENYTRFQSNFSDELFIEIPSRKYLLADEVTPMSTLPKRDEVCVPYQDEAAYKVGYETKGVSPYLFPLIEGRKENNGKSLYSNEEKYYRALDEWVRFNMKEEFGNANGNVIDLLSQEYLLELITTLYMWHWGHNPNVPNEIQDVSVSEENESSRYIFCSNGGGIPGFNAVIILHEFLKEASIQLGYQVFLDAVIQLARWGARKPTRIVLKGYDKEFDLGSGLIKSSIGDINDYQIVEFNGKSSSLVGLIYDDALIRDESIPVKQWGFPVGIVTKTVMENQRHERIELERYVHCLDVVELAKSGELSVSGLKYCDGVWSTGGEEKLIHCTVTALINSYTQNKEKLLQFPFYRGEDLQDMFIELQVNSARMPANLFSIMNTRVADPNLKKNAERAVFTDRSGMYQLIADGVVTSVVAAAELGVVRKLLPVYERVEACAPKTLVDTLTQWECAMQGKLSVGTEQMIESDSEMKMTVFNDTLAQKQEIPEKNLVGIIPQPEIKEVETQGAKELDSIGQSTNEGQLTQNLLKHELQDESSWLKCVPNDATLSRVVDGDGTVIGYCYKEGRVTTGREQKRYTCYTLVGERCIEERLVVENDDLNVNRIFALLLHNIFLSEIRGGSLRQIYFDSGDSISQYRDRLQQLSKLWNNG